jgi:excisionase family DNA binding protein
MPQILKSARNGQIAVKEFYSTGEIAFLMGVAHATASRLIDSGELRGLRLPTRRRQRRIAHRNLIAFVRRRPDFQYMLERLQGYDPRVDFPVGAEPPPAPTRKIGPAAPWGPEHPRSAKRGQIPQAAYYSAKEIAFVLGLARRTVIAKLDARVIPGVKVPATRSGLTTTWKWRIMHGVLVAFVRRNSRYWYAMDRIQGCESSSDAGASRAGEANFSSRKEPLVAPGAPGWRGRPNQTRRGGFKRGPKLPDGRQPSLTREDVAADSRTER